MLLLILLHTVFCVLIATLFSNTVRVIFMIRKEVRISSVTYGQLYFPTMQNLFILVHGSILMNNVKEREIFYKNAYFQKNLLKHVQ